MKKGFTLIELLVVVLIIGILAAIALPQYNKAVLKSRFAEPLTVLPAIKRAADICMMANNDDADHCRNFNNLDVEIPGTIVDSYTAKTKNFQYTFEVNYNLAAPAAFYLGSQGELNIGYQPDDDGNSKLMCSQSCGCINDNLSEDDAKSLCKALGIDYTASCFTC
ncbi:prepilin-type N-terminal cleavage/methylation domain-containing protein [Elusimicrobium simillimum]|uniref:pilin n=1 Tax=Elusimicrobium simillimum TaxID=3143438 RepID=UPI003C6FA10C